MGLLAAPLLVLVLVMGTAEALRPDPSFTERIARAPVSTAVPVEPKRLAETDLERSAVAARPHEPARTPLSPVGQRLAPLVEAAEQAPALSARPETGAEPQKAVVAAAPVPEAALPGSLAQAGASGEEAQPVAPGRLALAHPPAPEGKSAIELVPGPLRNPVEPLAAAAPLSPAEPPLGITAMTDGEPQQCAAPAVAPLTRVAVNADFVPGQDPEQFGLRLAEAARRQIDEFVIYNDKYTSLAYPKGDVSPFYGVCTDVLIRAYRAMGLDLQKLVHDARVGSGDTNIDHRRVDTLRKFFSTYGKKLSGSQYAEDYRPGDVVSYYRPQNAHSRTHIAIVSDVIGPSGRLMIIHNRGWGPQMEDALFVDEITGHYRYAGEKQPGGVKAVPVAGTPARPAPARAKARSAPVVKTSMKPATGKGVPVPFSTPGVN